MSVSRIRKRQLKLLQENTNRNFRNVEVSEKNSKIWTGDLIVDRDPYNLRAFKIQVFFPATYPLEPPDVRDLQLFISMYCKHFTKFNAVSFFYRCNS